MTNLIGQRFGMLVVTALSHRENHGIYKWHCKCDCGNESIASTSNLRNGNTTSCGCFGKEQRVKSVTKHGKCQTRVYRIWKAMHTRCYNEGFFAYKYYGGRGITICDEWKDNFQAFYDWAMANGYAENLTIDRIDSNGNYEPSNCQWATMEAQNKNKRAKNGYKI